ncbi:MAG: helix-hairpin-helix domain-containing protein [Ruminococcus sp.]|nr:helix-hairpin-helix domain-containing protein [Ruminococcus sp.]
MSREKQNSEAERPKLKPVYAFAAAGILLAAGVIGAALMAEHMSSRKEEGVRIYRSENTSGTETSSKKAAKEPAAVPAEAELSRDYEPAPVTTVDTTTQTAAETSAAFSFPADINRVSFEQLNSVSGINRSVAESIIAYRDKRGVIRNFEELLDIYGIGERTLAVIRERFFISGDDYRELETTVTTSKTTTSKVTTSKPVTTKATTSRTSKQTTAVTEPEAKEMREVDIQTADADEIADALLIDPELAERLVQFREKIDAFSDIREVMLVEGFTDEMYLERRDFMFLSYRYDGVKEESGEA